MPLQLQVAAPARPLPQAGLSWQQPSATTDLLEAENSFLEHADGSLWADLGCLFQLQILCEVDHFKVAVDDAHLLQYNFREKQLNKITRLCIAGDITLTSVLPTMI